MSDMITTADPITWHDCRPTHPRKPLALSNATDAVVAAQARYNDAVDRVYYDGRTADVTAEEYATLRELAAMCALVGAHYDDVCAAYHAGELTEQRWEEEAEHDTIEYGRHAMTEETLP